MGEIHDLQVHLLTSIYIFHDTVLSFKKLNVNTVIFILFKSGYHWDVKIIEIN